MKMTDHHVENWEKLKEENARLLLWHVLREQKSTHYIFLNNVTMCCTRSQIWSDGS